MPFGGFPRLYLEDEDLPPPPDDGTGGCMVGMAIVALWGLALAVYGVIFITY
jgi:hypothetical protein